MKAFARSMTAAELKQIVLKDNQEPLVHLDDIEGLLCLPRRQNLGKLMVRRSVALKLQEVQASLQRQWPSRQLMIVEGYRHPFVQERDYLHHFLMLARQHPTLDIADLEERVHQWVALPSVAGHPTGGAVDVSLVEQGREIDMGCAIADFSQPILLPTFSQALSLSQQRERLVLHELMIEAGFAPFYGEWWHFSFGDREWAAFYGHPHSHYGPLFLDENLF